ncbi:MarR family winged helix-turn-helix transcriptional regulator [Pseudomonas sp. NPDC090203]|uniref:MarR family winged helix-turn-helix transcriptional regulator n=1 Tax=Pseudomonas sp. NPDC090203 TaxID=3364477 RepID=UPI003830BAB1
MSSKPSDDTEHFAPLSEFLCFSIYSAGHALTQFYRPLLDKLGLTYPQYLLMVALWAKDDQIIKDLGNTLMLESSTLTPLIKRLEAAGLVSRSRDLIDERQVRVRLTPQGQALKTPALEVPNCIQDAVGLPVEDVMKLQAAVTDLRDRLLKKR